MRHEINGRIVVYGCGGHARSIISVLHDNGYQNIACIDENAKENEFLLGVEVRKHCKFQEDDVFVIAIGNNGKRGHVFQKLICDGICEDRFMTVIANTAIVCEEAELGRGIFVANSAFIGPCVKIGRDTIINTHSVIEHETVIGEHSHIAPGSIICGRCRIGNDVMIGAGSTVKDSVYICDNVTVGAGATVIADIKESGTYIGTPACKMEEDKG